MTVTLQAGFGFSALETGLIFLPFALSFSLASAASGWGTASLGPRILNLGTALMAVGLIVLLLACRAGMPVAWVAAAFAIYGAGQADTARAY